MKLAKLLIHIKSSLWFVPVLCVLAGALLSFGTIALDRVFDYGAIPASIDVGSDAAAVILTTIAASMVSLAALVLTITMVVVQLAMGQFSPRIVTTSGTSSWRSARIVRASAQRQRSARARVVASRSVSLDLERVGEDNQPRLGGGHNGHNGHKRQRSLGLPR